MKTSVSALALASLLSRVSLSAAHGFVSSMVIGGKTYAGPSPYTPSKIASPIRKITSINPITDTSSSAMTCGTGSKAGLASIVAPATAGSSITFTWKSGTGNWGHTVGPIETYIAKCEGSCVDFDASKATFFKIAEAGRKGSTMDWYQADINDGQSYTTTIPAHIPNGDYIIRHELIALHFATSKDGAQFYPSCSQVRITGGSTASSLAAVSSVAGGTFPGAYHQNDASLYVPNIYTSKNYVFPGPKVATFSGSSNASTPPTNSTVPSASLAPTSTSAPVTTPSASVSAPLASGTAKSCKHKKRASRMKRQTSEHAARRSRVSRRSH